MLLYLLLINLFAYLIMWIDKVKSLYQWWRISEKTLWIFALLGGVFGIWFGMLDPLYHKAGKQRFRFWIPIIALFWGAIVVKFVIKSDFL